jgi:hypothetical protein
MIAGKRREDLGRERILGKDSRQRAAGTRQFLSGVLVVKLIESSSRDSRESATSTSAGGARKLCSVPRFPASPSCMTGSVRRRGNPFSNSSAPEVCVHPEGICPGVRRATNPRR